MADLEDVYLRLDNLFELVAERLPVVDATAVPPKRKTLRKDDVLAALLAGHTRTGSEHSSVTLKTNAKGEPQIEITVRSGESDEVQTAADALAECSRLFLNAREMFGLANVTLTPSKGSDDGGPT